MGGVLAGGLLAGGLLAGGLLDGGGAAYVSLLRAIRLLQAALAGCALSPSPPAPHPPQRHPPHCHQSVVFVSKPRFIQALRAILRLQAALVDNAAGGLRPGSAPDVLQLPASAPVVFQLPASLVRHQRLATPAIIQHASLLTLLQRWFFASSSNAQRQLVDWPPTWSKTEVIKTRKHPDCYTRVTLKDKLAGANISVLHLYDAVREALTSGLLLVSPPFPILTATAVAKQERVSTRQMPYQSAALILIFTPVDILLQQKFSFTFDPLGRNRPPSRTTRIPTLNKSQQNALAAANAWANELMQQQ
jgi:hypothetical protein